MTIEQSVLIFAVVLVAVLVAVVVVVVVVVGETCVQQVSGCVEAQS